MLSQVTAEIPLNWWSQCNYRKYTHATSANFIRNLITITDRLEEMTINLLASCKTTCKTLTSSIATATRTIIRYIKWHDQLTHLPLDKMTANSQTIFSDAFSWTIFFLFWLKFQKFVPKGPIDNQSALGRVVAWRRTGDNHLNKCWPSLLTHICGTWGRWVGR